MTVLFTDDRPHPVPGMIDNPEWQYTLTRRAELYLAERARREENPEPSRYHIALGILAAIGVAVALAGSLL